jgi:hypothetical protein
MNRLPVNAKRTADDSSEWLRRASPRDILRSLRYLPARKYHLKYFRIDLLDHLEEPRIHACGRTADARHRVGIEITSIDHMAADAANP